MYRQRNSAAFLPYFDNFRWDGKVEQLRALRLARKLDM